MNNCDICNEQLYSYYYNLDEISVKHLEFSKLNPKAINICPRCFMSMLDEYTTDITRDYKREVN